jgi:hypothetical protein
MLNTLHSTMLMARGHDTHLQRLAKTFPGDPNWPKDIVWDVFNLMLGGALIPTKPIAASCYDSQWGKKKNAAKCTDIISNFTDAYFHQHNPTFKILAYLPGKNLYAKE